MSTNDILVALEKHYTDKVIEIKEIRKNNGVVLTGVIIRSSDESVSPVIYIDSLLDKEDAVERIIDIYENNCKPELNTSLIMSYEDMKPYLSLILVNKETNKDIIDNYIGFDFLDLYAVVIIRFDDIHGTTKVTHQLASVWGVEKDQIIADAQANLKSSPTVITNLTHILSQMMDDIPDMDEIPIWVVKGLGDTYGAARMLDSYSLENFACQHDMDLFVIPSSVHELLIFAYNDERSDYIDEIINEVNMFHVEPEEVLSDHVYIYKRGQGWL